MTMTMETQDAVALNVNRTNALLTLINAAGHDVEKAVILEAASMALEQSNEAAKLLAGQPAEKKPGGSPTNQELENALLALLHDAGQLGKKKPDASPADEVFQLRAVSKAE